MKKVLLLAVALVTTQLSAKAQMPYNVSTSVYNYQPLTNGTVVTDTTAWDDGDAFPINIPFQFKVNGKTVSQIIISSSAIAVTDTAMPADAFSLLGAELVDRGIADTNDVSTSPISYQVAGSAGNRIFKIEIANAGFVEEWYQSATTNDSINLQLWLYETSNAIEVRFGSAYVSNFNQYFPYGVLTGFINDINMSTGDMGKSYMLKGSSSAPTVDTFNMNNPTSGITNLPALGTVYRFSPKPTSIGQQINAAHNKVTVYPTLCKDHITIEHDLKDQPTYTLTNMSGQTIKRGIMNNSKEQLSLSDIPTGNYLLKIQSATYHNIVKLSKQ